MSRVAADEYFLRGAEWVSSRGTCARRKVGCILVNKRGHIIGTGYNGVAAGADHCIDAGHACLGATAKSGQNLEQCEAIHAEQNALLQCGDVYQIYTAYVTHSPCITCVKLLLATSCQRIVFRNAYAHDQASRALWHKLRQHTNLPKPIWIEIPHGDRE